MPHFLCRPIAVGLRGLWGEGPAYERENIFAYGAQTPGPPVHYDEHKLRPHSICHAETMKHIQKGGTAIHEVSLSAFVGWSTVAKIRNPKWQQADDSGTSVVRVGRESLEHALLESGPLCERLLLSCDPLPLDSEGYHDSKFALVLEVDAAEWLIEEKKLRLFGTSFKSVDFQPGSSERPIHSILFRSAAVLELLDVHAVAPGRYYLVAPPLPLVGASEAPVVPVLFSEKEWGGS